jgi:SNF2 family DNA or RNA helicase
MRGRWVRADPERLRRVKERRAVSAGEVLSAALSGTVTIDGEEVDAEIDDAPLVDLAARLDAAESTAETWSPPAGLGAELRPYQRRGVQWLLDMADIGLGGVLADDMGLGKTVQVLALHLSRNGPDAPADRRGPMLVVCPASVLGNWEREAHRFVPGIPVRRHHGATRELAVLAPDEIVITTYGVVRRDAGELAAIGWDLVIADEAQAVKNPYSRTAGALRRIPARARFALTGTPVENRLSDLWALLDWTTPGLLGKLDVFRRTVAVPVERERDEHATARLAAIVRPFLLRRRKSDPLVAPDLPPKTETDQFVGLTSEQATLYRAVTEELVEEVQRNEGINRRGLVLKLLTALKQICNHPAQYLGQNGPIDGRSGKIEAVTDLLSVITDEGDSVLVFTQFVAMGRLLEAHLATVGIDTAFLHGSTPIPRREEMVDEFQAGRPQVLIVSLKAGGTGLNLTRATHVVHYDRWWNPAVEDQASDRAWRIGQDRPVQVHRMMCEGTLEERIAGVLDAKRQLADAVVGGGEAWITELSDEDLADLVALGGIG